MTTQTRLDAAKLVAGVLADGGRSDRNLMRTDDGSYFTTPDREYLTDSGAFGPPYIGIPIANGGTDDLIDWAFSLLDNLDESIGMGLHALEL